MESSGSYRSDYDVDPEVVAEARRLGLYGNVAARLARMARYAAPYRHEAGGNRRFEGWALRLENGRVTGIWRIGPPRMVPLVRQTAAGG